MPNSKALVNFALRSLNCNQKDLAEKLEVSAGQISKWKKHGEYMSTEIEDKLRRICKIGEIPEDLLEKFGSIETAATWHRLCSYLAKFSLETTEWSYECHILEDFDHWNVSSDMYDLLNELGVMFPAKIPRIEDESDIFEDPFVKIICMIFESLICLSDFFTCFFHDLVSEENIYDDMMELEACLIYLAACKANLNPSLTPNINAFKFEWLRWHHRKIDDIKCKAIQSAKPLREELKKMITDPVEHLSADTEKEVMGLNIDKVHPDIYMNELLIGMRTANKILPTLLEKLDIKLLPQDA